MAAAVTVAPGTRFIDPDKPLALADLNAAGAPIMKVVGNSIGALELITADVEALISEVSVGNRFTYTFPGAVTYNTYGNKTPIILPIPLAHAGDPIKISPVRNAVSGLDINVQFWGICRVDGTVTVSIYSNEAGAVTIPAGATFTVIVFTPLTLPPGGGPNLGGGETPGTTGYITVTPGYVWKMNDAISPEKLDLTCQPTGLIPNASVGRREIDPEAIARIVAPARGGVPFAGVTPANLPALSPGGATTFPIAFAGATVGQIPIVASIAPILPVNDFLWGGNVSAANSINIVLRNLTDLNFKFPGGIPFKGRLI